MIHSILQLDRKIFFIINNQWHNPVFDAVLPFVRNPYFWAPLYLFLLFFMLMNFKWNGAIWVLFFLATFGLTDSVTAHILKELVVRYRPCHDPVFSQYVRSLVPCSGGHSFPSNHAANHFGLATFLFLSLKKTVGRWIWVAFIWAFLVCYAQVYVGVHYPLDILGGTCVGLIFGTITGKIFNKKFQLAAS